MILLGYLLTFGWVFLVLGATLALKKRLHTGDEVSRKIVHICVAFAWVPMTLCFGVTWHMVVPPAVFRFALPTNDSAFAIVGPPAVTDTVAGDAPFASVSALPESA